MIITQTKISKNIRIQQYNLIAKELEVERNMDDNTIQLIIIDNLSENAVKCIRGHRGCLLYRGPERSSSHGPSWKMQAVYTIKLSSSVTRYSRNSVLGYDI